MSGDDVKRAANPHDKRHAQSIAVSGEESLLARRRHGNEKAVRFTIDDLLDNFPLLFRPKITVSQTGNLDGGKRRGYNVGRTVQNAARRPEKKRPVAVV